MRQHLRVHLAEHHTGQIWINFRQLISFRADYKRFVKVKLLTAFYCRVDLSISINIYSQNGIPRVGAVTCKAEFHLLVQIDDFKSSAAGPPGQPARKVSTEPISACWSIFIISIQINTNGTRIFPIAIFNGNLYHFIEA